MITHSVRQQARARWGFSWTAIAVTIAVIGVLVGAAVPMTNRLRTYEAGKATRLKLQSLCDASAHFFSDTRRLPESLAELLVKPVDKEWGGPYLTCVATDPIEQLAEVQLDGWSRAFRFDARGDDLTIASGGEDGQFADTPDLVVRLDTKTIRRTETLDRLKQINRAIALYNGKLQFTEPLPSDWSRALDQLVAKGYLPERKAFEIDGWGGAFVADPAGKEPLVRVISPALHVDRAARERPNKTKG
jgi:hypothetical protein